MMKYNFDDLKAAVEHSRKHNGNKRVLPADVNEPVRVWLKTVDPDLVATFDEIENKQWHQTWLVIDKQNPLKNFRIKFNYGIVESYEIMKETIGSKWIEHLTTKIKNENVFFGKKINKPTKGENHE